MKSLLYSICVLAISFASAQQPFINSVDKSSGTANEVVNIAGAGFSTPTVYFGNGKVTTIVSSSATLLSVKVPATATYGPIRVVNSNGLAATSRQLFAISFDKDDASKTFIFPTLSTPLPTSNLAYDICVCDFTGDGYNDVIIANDDAGTDATVLSIFRNTSSSPSSVSFASETSDFLGDGNTAHAIVCGDLNGDGKPDLVFTSHDSGQPFVHVYENNSTGSDISFIKRHRLQLPTLDGGAQRIPKNVRIVDIDVDGKMDLVVGSDSEDDNNIFVFRNNFTSGGIVSYVTNPTVITVPNLTQTGSFDVGDFDNDGKPDLVVMAALFSGQLQIMRNTSLPGSISFDYVKAVGTSGRQRYRVAVADFNLDGRVDIAATRIESSGGSIEIYQNNGDFAFGTVTPIVASATLYGLDIGDMNGDGFPDVVAGSIGAGNRLVYFENNRNSINISMASAITTTTTVPRNVRISDINNDGKPDISFVNNSKDSTPGEFLYAINNLCMTPVITPTSGKYCNLDDFILTATAGEGVTYSWTVTGDSPSPVSTGTTNQLNISGYSNSITVSVTATSPDGCAIPSTSRNFTVGSASQATPVITDPGVICVGDPLTLVSTTTGLAEYIWSGPNGFNDITNVPSIDISASATSVHAGTYTLIVNDGDCNSPAQTIDIIVSAPPITSIAVNTCTSGTVTLGVPDLSSQGILYQWKRNGVDAGGSDNVATYVTSTAGEYTVVLTDGNGCDFETDGYNLFSTSFTGPTFTAPNEVCVGVQSTYTSSQSSLQNKWEIEDPVGNVVTTLTGTSIDYTFATTGSKKIRLFSSDLNGVGCTEKTITVSAAPTSTTYTVDISAPAVNITANSASKCPSESVILSFDDAGVDSYVWNDPLSTTGPLTVTVGGDYTPTITTTTGCEIAGQTISITDFPGLNLTSASPSIVDGVLEMNDGQISVDLSVDVTVVNPVWQITSGTGTISGSGSQISVLTSSPSLVVSVSGQTADGCDEVESVNILAGSAIAKKVISPNGDGNNDCWEIINSVILEACTVYIVDSRGANILSATSPFESDCIWDGTYNGKDVPEGVYYFVLKCADNSKSQTGSILLAR